MSRPIRGQGGHLVFRSARKRQTLYRAFRSCFLSSVVEFRSGVSEEKSKMSQPIRGQDGHLFFSIGPKNTNLVEGVEILLPVKFRWILFSGFRGEVVNVPANQRPGRSSCFFDRPEKQKLGRGCWDLASCQVRWISLSGFRGEVENVSANQRPGRPSCFSDRSKNTNLLPVKFVEFRAAVSEEKSKMWKVYGRTDDGRCAMTIAHSSLRLRWAKNGRIGNERALIGESVCWSKIQRGLAGPALRGRGERDKLFNRLKNGRGWSRSQPSRMLSGVTAWWSAVQRRLVIFWSG